MTGPSFMQNFGSLPMLDAVATMTLHSDGRITCIKPHSPPTAPLLQIRLPEHLRTARRPDFVPLASVGRVPKEADHLFGS